jgi:hypothetical protein
MSSVATELTASLAVVIDPSAILAVPIAPSAIFAEVTARLASLTVVTSPSSTSVVKVTPKIRMIWTSTLFVPAGGAVVNTIELPAMVNRPVFWYTPLIKTFTKSLTVGANGRANVVCTPVPDRETTVRDTLDVIVPPLSARAST